MTKEEQFEKQLYRVGRFLKQTMNKKPWYKPSEKLPTPGQFVVLELCCDLDEYEMGFYNDVIDEWIDMEGNPIINAVLHWKEREHVVFSKGINE